jgi:hypothetical protein
MNRTKASSKDKRRAKLKARAKLQRAALEQELALAAAAALAGKVVRVVRVGNQPLWLQVARAEEEAAAIRVKTLSPELPAAAIPTLINR